MKIKEHTAKGRFSGRLAVLLLVFVLAAGAVTFMPPLDGEAKAVDFNRNCSLTVAPCSPELSDKVAEADVVIDLYRVADAQQTDENDTYQYTFLDSYKSLAETYGNSPVDTDLMAMAQSAAKIAFDGGKPAVSGAAPNTAISDLKCGLYLVVARGKNVKDYKTTVTREDGTELLATTARSDKATYTYVPMLVLLPGRQAEDGSVSNNTSGSGQWVYDRELVLKPSEDLLCGSLEIIKELKSSGSEPADFVFEIEATLEGEVVYSNVVSLSFSEPGEKHALLDDIPIGAQVTVREVYSGTAYKLVSAGLQTARITAEDVAAVRFVNEYTGSNKGGGAIVNHFEKDKDSGWAWTQLPDNSAKAE